MKNNCIKILSLLACGALATQSYASVSSKSACSAQMYLMDAPAAKLSPQARLNALQDELARLNALKAKMGDEVASEKASVAKAEKAVEAATAAGKQASEVSKKLREDAANIPRITSPNLRALWGGLSAKVDAVKNSLAPLSQQAQAGGTEATLQANFKVLERRVSSAQTLVKVQVTNEERGTTDDIRSLAEAVRSAHGVADELSAIDALLNSPQFSTLSAVNLNAAKAAVNLALTTAQEVVSQVTPPVLNPAQSQAFLAESQKASEESNRIAGAIRNQIQQGQAQIAQAQRERDEVAQARATRLQQLREELQKIKESSIVAGPKQTVAATVSPLKLYRLSTPGQTLIVSDLSLDSGENYGFQLVQATQDPELTRLNQAVTDAKAAVTAANSKVTEAKTAEDKAKSASKLAQAASDAAQKALHDVALIYDPLKKAHDAAQKALNQAEADYAALLKTCYTAEQKAYAEHLIRAARIKEQAAMDALMAGPDMVGALADVVVALANLNLANTKLDLASTLLRTAELDAQTAEYEVQIAQAQLDIYKQQHGI